VSRPADRFPRAHGLRKGYHRRQVDAFLDRVELSLQGALPPMTAAEVRRAGFPLVRRGYRTAVVDAALDELEERAMARQAATTSRRGRVDPAAEAAFLREEIAAPYAKRFPRVRPLRRGYDIDDVDDFLDRVAAALAGGPPLTVDAVRHAAFRPRRGGYGEEAVDETLDRVVELLLLTRAAAPPVAAAPPTAASATATERTPVAGLD
jgi:DivIVA domain-containing protein